MQGFMLSSTTVGAMVKELVHKDRDAMCRVFLKFIILAVCANLKMKFNQACY